MLSTTHLIWFLVAQNPYIPMVIIDKIVQIIQFPNNPPAVPINLYRFPLMTDFSQIHLNKVHIKKGVAKPSVITKRIGIHKQKTKTCPAVPENFGSIKILQKKILAALFRVPQTHFYREIVQ